jgi:hypothetical protein
MNIYIFGFSLELNVDLDMYPIFGSSFELNVNL